MLLRRAVVTLFCALTLGCSAAELLPGAAVPATPSGYIPTPAAATPAPAATPIGEPVASTAALPPERLPTAQFVASGQVRASIPIEVLPQGEFSIGLSGRAALGERGMLFDYGKPGNDGPFWMKGTHFDLDIAFIDDTQRIVSIRTMRAESLDYTYSAAPYRSAIEVMAGWFSAHGIREGDSVRYVPPVIPTP